MKEFMLSLTANPYDPFTEFSLWSEFDRREGFDTAGLIARTAIQFDGMPDQEVERQMEAAVDSFVNNPHFAGLYKKVERQ